MYPVDFIQTLLPGALSSQLECRIPASFTIAEAALESGWGASQLSIQAHNLFGVKADPAWTGPTLDMRTREFLHGTWTMVIAHWRKYDSFDDCIRDHAAFLRSNPRYSACFNLRGGVDFARGVANAGYATDPSYADKIVSIIQAHNLTAYDLKE